MKLQVVRVTPEIAERWLKNNGKNRNLSSIHAKRLAAVMAAGKWSLNGQTISFDDQGRLLDGQHRLTAVIISGVPIDMAVATEVVDERAFQTYDAIQLKRGANQIARMMSPIKNATKVAAGARIVMAWEAASTYYEFINYFSGSRLVDPFPEDVAAKSVEISEEFNVVFDSLGVFIKLSKARSAWVAMVMILNRIDPVSTESFIYKLREGLFTDASDPVKLLRDKMIKDGGYGGAASNDRQFTVLLIHLTVKAWNAHVKGKVLPLLRYSPGQNETIPVPVGSPKK